MISSSTCFSLPFNNLTDREEAVVCTPRKAVAAPAGVVAENGRQARSCYYVGGSGGLGWLLGIVYQQRLGFFFFFRKDKLEIQRNKNAFVDENACWLYIHFL